ncbi:MAG: hypothetical protein RBT11_02430 [Desulfobacterales bacterium]|jgi:hypothetical protein|nr:hypothetical protein [Desulfobacterales bacterium]
MKKIYDDIFEWEGWGGKLKLASGKCYLRIFNLKSETTEQPTPIKPVIVVVSDIPGGTLSVRSCAGHIATQLTVNFHIDPQRMLYVEYYPPITYGGKENRVIPERYEAVEFVWREEKAIQPRWRPLPPPLVEMIEKVMAED